MSTTWKSIIITLPNGNMISFEELSKDLQASKKKYHQETEFSFTAVTVQGLMNKILELQEELDELKK